MFEFKLIRDANGQIAAIKTNLTGNELLSTPTLNKGCAFTLKERDELGLLGLLPGHVETLEEQTKRMYMQYHEHITDLSKHIYLNVLHDYNETLFYRLISDHLSEMLPIIYTPTVGEAVQRFSLELRKPRGLYIAYHDRDRMDSILDHTLPTLMDLAVITDGEAVLGLGDQGIGGINIASAKLMVYTLCGGINPHRVIPIQLDVGTNNIQLLNDPMYLGWRHERITPQEYDDFIDQFVRAMRKKFPSIYLHWEDISHAHARSILNRYREEICTINGDIQATGVIALAAVLAAAKASDKPLPDHRVVIFGAGTAGVGIADQLLNAMIRGGLSEKEARSRFYLIDKNGLLMKENVLLSFQANYAKSPHELIDWPGDLSKPIALLDVVKYAKASILIGSSAIAGAFNEEVVQAMSLHGRPIIMPLSNPTSRIEAKPADLLNWTKGKAFIATGSPFPDVDYNGRSYRIAQSNNALAFPGIGLGVIACKATHLTDNMLWAAAQAINQCSPVHQDKTAALLPKLTELKKVSHQVALAVMKAAREDGATRIDKKTNLNQLIAEYIWEPAYYPIFLLKKK